MAAATRVNFAANGTWNTTSLATIATLTAIPITAGNTILVAVGGMATAGQTVVSITDTAGNTYTKIDHIFDSVDLYRQEYWYAKNVLAHATNIFTVTWSAAVTYRGIAAIQLIADPVNPIEGFAKGTAAAGATSVTSGTLTTTKWDTLHIMFPRWGLTETYPTGFTSVTPDTNITLADKYVIDPYVGTYTLTYSSGTNGKHIFVIAIAPVQTTPENRISQDAIEVITSKISPEFRVTQYAVEVLISSVGVTSTEKIQTFVVG